MNYVQYPVFMITVPATASIEILKNAVEGATKRARELHIDPPRIVGVTVLTGENLGADTLRVVLERAHNAKDAGLDGVVCAASEAEMIRKEFGEKFIIVTPGIRPKGYKKDDQARVATAQEAIAAGANFIVVGRPILEAKDPLKAAEEIILECKN